MYIPNGFYVYKWVYNDNVIYVGQSRDLKNRISKERRDKKFLSYTNANIFFVRCKNMAEMDILEKTLINKYQPQLNTTYKYPDTIDLPFNTSALEWIDLENYDEYNEYLINSEDQVNKIKDLKKKVESLEFENERLRKQTNFSCVDNQMFDLIKEIKEQINYIDVLEYKYHQELEAVKNSIIKKIYYITEFMDEAGGSCSTYSRKIGINPSKLE